MHLVRIHRLHLGIMGRLGCRCLCTHLIIGNRVVQVVDLWGGWLRWHHRCSSGRVHLEREGLRWVHGSLGNSRIPLGSIRTRGSGSGSGVSRAMMCTRLVVRHHQLSHTVREPDGWSWLGRWRLLLATDLELTCDRKGTRTRNRVAMELDDLGVGGIEPKDATDHTELIALKSLLLGLERLAECILCSLGTRNRSLHDCSRIHRSGLGSGVCGLECREGSDRGRTCIRLGLGCLRGGCG